MSGAVQVTRSAEVGEPDERVTVGAAGMGGGSLTSVTWMVTVFSASTMWSSMPMMLRPSLAWTTTV